MKEKPAVKFSAKRARDLTSFLAMDILEEAEAMRRAGSDVINFSIGEPDFAAPQVVKQATIAAIRGNDTKYTHSLGALELRDVICDHYRKRYGVRLSPQQVLVTPGTSPAMLLAFGALLDPGDEVVMSNPHYPCYSNFVRFLQGKVRYVKVRAEEGFQYRPGEVEKQLGKRTKAIFINSPSNPTGSVLETKVLEALAKMGPMVISDEIYHGLTYEGEERSILEFTDRAFVLNGFSKAYAMTGFRLGYLIAPQEFIPVLQRMQQNFFISTSSFIQKAGIAAMLSTEKEQKTMKAAFNLRRIEMLKGVRSLGFEVPVEPTGAFYIFANAKRFCAKSYDFCFDLLRKARVGITPGIDFGSNGEGYVRFSYALDLKQIHEGLNRIEGYLKKKKLI